MTMGARDRRTEATRQGGGATIGDRRVDTLVIGGGQAGLSVGHRLARRDQDFVILDAGERVGDAWRHRWDSLRLFTPNRYNTMDGMAFPGDPDAFPTKDEMADYLQAYADRFDLPVRSGVRVRRLTRDGDEFVAETASGRWRAHQVVVAMGTFQQPSLPDFATQLDPDIVQLHSHHYRNPSQLQDGPVLVVGAGNSGAEIGLELAAAHDVEVAGRPVGQVPFDIRRPWSRPLVRLVLRGIFHRVLSVDTPMGRRARPKLLHAPAKLVRTREGDLRDAGVARAPRVEGIDAGQPFLADGRRLRVANVVWCTGFTPGFSWIDLPVFDERGDPRHDRGVSPDVSGLYFVGLHFLRAVSSGQVHGVGRDAAHVVDRLVARATERGRQHAGREAVAA